jgi:hypothetical protein
VARYVVRYILDNKPSPGVLKVEGVEIIAMFSPIKYLVETDNEGLAHLEKHLSIAWVITPEVYYAGKTNRNILSNALCSRSSYAGRV